MSYDKGASKHNVMLLQAQFTNLSLVFGIYFEITVVREHREETLTNSFYYENCCNFLAGLLHGTI